MGQPDTSHFNTAFFMAAQAEKSYRDNKTPNNESALISAVQAVFRQGQSIVGQCNSFLQDDITFAIADAGELASRHGIDVPRLEAA